MHGFFILFMLQNNKQKHIMFINMQTNIRGVYMKHNDLFWDATLDELTQGYVYDEQTEQYTCLICGKEAEKGQIYQLEEGFFEAEKFLKKHIVLSHNSMFDYLLNMNKKYTGLTDHQKELLNFFHEGYSDKDITTELGGSSATIRNHRFKLKEKEKQAKIFLAIMMLLNKKDTGQKNITIHKGATMVDERYDITEQERDKVLKTYFDESQEKLSTLPSKEKRKIIVLQKITSKFEIGKKYTEKEINDILKNIYEDFVTIRRYLIEYGFLDRNKDGSAYWVKV